MSGRVNNYLDQFSVWGTYILTNLTWVLLAIPVVTLPLATVGLFQVTSKGARGKPPEFFSDFFGAMRQHWAQACLVGLLDALVGGLVVLNLSIIALMGEGNVLGIMARSAALLVGLVLLLTNLYIWSLLVVAELPLKQLLSTAFRLVATHPLWSGGILIAASIPVVISLFIPVLFLLLGAVVLSAWIINWGTWHIIRRYIPDEERRALEAAPLP